MTELEADLGPLPNIHPREAVISQAKSELRSAAMRVFLDSRLSYAELFVCLTATLAFFADSALIAQYMNETSNPPGSE